MKWEKCGVFFQTYKSPWYSRLFCRLRGFHVPDIPALFDAIAENFRLLVIDPRAEAHCLLLKLDSAGGDHFQERREFLCVTENAHFAKQGFVKDAEVVIVAEKVGQRVRFIGHGI